MDGESGEKPPQAPSQGLTRGFTLHCWQRTPTTEVHWLSRIHKSHVEPRASEQGFEMSVDGLLCILEACLEGQDVSRAYDIESYHFDFKEVNSADEELWSDLYHCPSPDSAGLDVTFTLKVRLRLLIFQFRLFDMTAQLPWTLSFKFRLARAVSTPRQLEPLEKPPTMRSSAGMQLAWWTATKKANSLRQQLLTEREVHAQRHKGDTKTIARLRELISSLQSEVGRLQRQVNSAMMKKSLDGDDSMLPPVARRASRRSSRGSALSQSYSTRSLVPAEESDRGELVPCLKEEGRKTPRKSVKLEEPFPSYKAGVPSYKTGRKRRRGRSLKSERSEKTRADTETEEV